MNKASPVELRKTAGISDALIKSGIDFVPVIVKDEFQKRHLMDKLKAELDYLEEKAEIQESEK